MTRLITTHDQFLAKAMSAKAAGFSSKAAQKEAMSNLNSAYGAARDMILEGFRPMYAKDESGYLDDSDPETQKLSKLSWSIPFDLHHYREKHTKALLAVSDVFQSAIDLIENLVAQRNEIKAMAILPKKTKSELMQEESLSLNTPVAIAVRALREEAIEQAKERCLENITLIHKVLDKAGWNKQEVADKYSDWIANITRPANADELPEVPSYMLVNHRKPCADREQAYIGRAVEMAAFEYDMFVWKLNEKIGAHKAASLEGSHVWAESTLTITKDDDSEEKWKTKSIINYSKYGNPFNQYPTRLIK